MCRRCNDGGMSSSVHEQRFIEGVVANLRLFGDAEPAQVTAVARQSWTMSARRGDTLARRGERLPGVFVLAYGLAKLALRGPVNEERVLRLVSAGQTFGEATALLGQASRYEALVLLDAKVVVIPSAPIFGLMDREPRFGRAIARMLAERNFELLAEVESATLLRSAQRLAAYLGSLAERGADSAALSVRLPVSKTLVAARLGIKKETLSRLLRRFIHDGLIEVSRGEIAILDLAALARLGST